MELYGGMSAGQWEAERGRVLQNLRAVLQESAKSVPLENFQADGTWSDVDYQSHILSDAWTPSRHLTRMFQLAGTRPELAVKALSAWQKLDPSSKNWWWGCIGIPRQLCNTILLIGPENIPEELLKKIEPVIRRSMQYQKKFTGQNLVWVEEIRLCTGLIYRDAALVREGRDVILSELKIAEPGREGLQSDFTFHQHGTQNQIGNYGLSFLTTQLHWARGFNGTSLAYPPEQFSLLERYFRECLRWTLLDGIMDYNFCGRQLTEGAPAAKYRTLMKTGRQLLNIIPECCQQEFRAWLDAPEALTGAKAFPNSGSLIYRAADGWYFSVRMSSAKLKGCETVIGENLQGKYQEDGLSFFGSMKRYRGFPVLYDQRHLPGTTEVQDHSPLCCTKHNTGGFYAVLAGFPSAIAAMHLEAQELRADKVWFCTSAGVYCSGSGIHADSTEPVVTTVDQYDADSEAFFPVEWTGGRIRRKIETRIGNWKDSFAESPSKEITGRVVTLFIDHGVRPSGDVYRYALRKKTAEKISAVWLECSSPRIHALAADDRILTAAFEDGTVKLPGGSVLHLAQGIAVCSADGQMLEHADFREQ